MGNLKPLVVSCLLSVSLGSVAVDANDRRFIREGMAEGEVVLKIGKPDYEAFVSNHKGQPEVKTWTYFPTSRDPQTVTVLTLRAGVVATVERKISR